MNNEVRNTSAIAEFEDKTPAQRRVGAELAASREAQEVQVAMVGRQAVSTGCGGGVQPYSSGLPEDKFSRKGDV